jgi:hypothetical protein
MPALTAIKRSLAKARKNPSAIWLLVALPVERNSTLGFPSMAPSLSRRFTKSFQLFDAWHRAIGPSCLAPLYLSFFLRQSQEWKPALAWLEAIYYLDWRIALEIAGIALVIFSTLMDG